MKGWLELLLSMWDRVSEAERISMMRFSEQV